MNGEISAVVVVTKIESFTETQTGRRGKKIEFMKIKQPSPIASFEENPEVKIVKEMLMQLKTMGFPLISDTIRMPKMILYLFPEEEAALDLDFQVNHVYKIIFEKSRIMFQDVTEEYYYVS
jgi:hypothetical protein